MIGIDLTAAEIEAPKIRHSVLAYINRNSDDGTLIIAVAITGRTLTQPVILAQIQLPKYRGIKEKEKTKAMEKFDRDLSAGLEKKGAYPRSFFQQSRITDFFNLAGNIFDEYRIPAKSRRMVLFSDMLQVDERCNWERDREINAQHLRIHQVGGSVAVYGVQSPLYSNPDKWEKVRVVWIELLKKAGIHVLTYASTYPSSQ